MIRTETVTSFLRQILVSGSSGIGAGGSNTSTWVPLLSALLPEVFSSIFTAAEYWRQSTYLGELHVFAGNEHAAMLCLSRLLEALPDEQPKELYRGGSEFEGHAQRYVRLSAQVISELRLREMGAYSTSGSSSSALPLRPMTLLLQSFLTFAQSLLSPGDVEDYLPRALLHSVEVRRNALDYLEVAHFLLPYYLHQSYSVILRLKFPFRDRLISHLDGKGPGSRLPARSEH